MAVIVGIGTANPPNCIMQEDYPHFYLGLSSSHSLLFHQRFILQCEKTGIKKRYMHLTEKILRENPTLMSHDGPSLSLRQRLSEEEIPRLGREAALRAIHEWGQPIHTITHLIFCSIQAVHMPGADFRLTLSLGLPLSTRRVMLYHQGCNVSISALRLAKDFAENNPGSRVLVVCCDMTIGSFRGPCENDMEDVIMQTTFGDGAAAVIVGADVDKTRERPLFRIVSEAQMIIPDSDKALCGYVRENGYSMERVTKVPGFIATSIGGHINDFLEKMLEDSGINIGKDWNSVFWVMQATAKPVLDRIEAELKLDKDKLEISREVWRDYGYLMSSSTLFVLNEVNKRFSQQIKQSSDSEYGVMVGFGAGLTLDAVVLQRVSLPSSLSSSA